ncbi:unnamed protein product [Cladocopium goreaui]|uniref:Modification methylase ScrFIA n=1 Tax=Cladocopium goreaui TaxID=2562237 RepID=A0A9P1BG05_9DINO|nr:unnamed protein product [Cladocopium goreaui]
MVLLALSPSLVTSGSSRTCEILSAGLSKLAAKIDFRSVWLNLQADNSSKEVKNVGALRLVGLWICLRKLGGAQISFLSSGHSHEDIDAMFSVIRAHLERNHELPTPLAFRDCLRSFFDDPHHRPHERLRCVELLSRYKDWTNWTSYLFDHMRLKGIGGTKQWMSDGTWQPTTFLFLPASVARAAQVFTETPVNPLSNENKALRKYAQLMRRDPFDMIDAAQQLEELSYGFLDPTLLDTSWALPQHGAAAVGRSALPTVRGRCFALYRAAAQLWRHGVNIAHAIEIVTEAVQESMHQ